ncbi:MAG: Tfp pilus assembly protein FimT/FimU [Undibacterium sp.]
MFERHYSKKGFTLAEVLIVVAIIAIATAFMLVSVTTQRGARGVDRAAREVASALREAQGYAITGRSTSGEDNCWIGIDIAAAGGNYTVMNTYRTGATCATNSNGTIASYSLKDGVTFTSAPERLTFSIPRGEVYYLSGGLMTLLAPGASWIIGVTKNGATEYVCVYSTGRIIENRTSSTCP